MKRKFLKAVLVRATDFLMENSGDTCGGKIWLATVVLLRKVPDATDIQAKAWGG